MKKMNATAENAPQRAGIQDSGTPATRTDEAIDLAAPLATTMNKLVHARLLFSLSLSSFLSLFFSFSSSSFFLPPSSFINIPITLRYSPINKNSDVRRPSRYITMIPHIHAIGTPLKNTITTWPAGPRNPNRTNGSSARTASKARIGNRWSLLIVGMIIAPAIFDMAYLRECEE